MTNEQKPVRKYTPLYFWLKWQVSRDEDFLLRQGIRKAKEQGLELNIGAQHILTPEKKKGRIYLPPCKNGVDIKELLSIVADDYPDVARRYLDNKKRLSQ